MFAGTEFGAFQALRLHEKHDLDVQIEHVEPFEPTDAPEHIREAAKRYEAREEPATPYKRFASGRDLPDPDQLRGVDL